MGKYRGCAAGLAVTMILQLGAGPATQSATAQSDQARITELQTKLDKAQNRIDELEHQVSVLKKQAEIIATETPRPAVPQVSHWDGIFTVSKSISKFGTKGTMSFTDGTHFILHVEVENGSVWNFECSMGGNEFNVDKFVRVKAGPGPHPNDIAGMSGRGKIADGELTLQYHWLHGKQDTIGTYDLHKN